MHARARIRQDAFPTADEKKLHALQIFRRFVACIQQSDGSGLILKDIICRLEGCPVYRKSGVWLALAIRERIVVVKR
ncbi:MAG: hypothetical protein ACLVGL_17170 [Waltera sp.]